MIDSAFAAAKFKHKYLNEQQNAVIDGVIENF